MRRVFSVALISVPFFVVVSAAEKKESLPPGWESGSAPRIPGFDPDAVTAAARKALGIKKGGVALVPMNSRASEEDLVKIIDGLKDVHSRGEPVICVSKDADFIDDAVGRTLRKFKDINLAGLRMVVAAPNRPSKQFLGLLQSRRIHYVYLKSEPKK